MIVGTEKVSSGSRWACVKARGQYQQCTHGWKVVPWLRLERTGEPVRSPNITSAISGNYMYRHHVEPRVKLYMPREESFPIPLRYTDVIRPCLYCWSAALTIVGTSKGTEICRMRGQDSHDSPYWKNNLQMGRHSGLTSCGQRCGKTCEKQRNENKNKSGLSKKPNLDNARRLRGIYFTDPADAEFKETIQKKTRRKLEVPMPAPTP